MSGAKSQKWVHQNPTNNQPTNQFHNAIFTKSNVCHCSVSFILDRHFQESYYTVEVENQEKLRFFRVVAPLDDKYLVFLTAKLHTFT